MLFYVQQTLMHLTHNTIINWLGLKSIHVSLVCNVSHFIWWPINGKMWALLHIISLSVNKSITIWSIKSNRNISTAQNIFILWCHFLYLLKSVLTLDTMVNLSWRLYCKKIKKWKGIANIKYPEFTPLCVYQENVAALKVYITLLGEMVLVSYCISYFYR